MFINSIVKLFEQHSVSVSGEKGSGKDVLFGNVIHRRALPYVSNVDYGGDYIPYKYEDIDIHSTFHDLIRGNVRYYEWPHPMGADIYLSDCGIYFPSQYCNELNKAYPSIPIYMSLSRHLSLNGVHTNTQAFGRVWDKLREQSTIFIRTDWICKPLLKIGIVLQHVTIYDRYESAKNLVKPCRITVPFSLNAEARMSAQIYRDNFYNQHGNVQSKLLIYINKSKHDTYFFRSMFKEGKKI